MLTEALGNATLLTSNHFGHGAVDLANECVVSHVRAYLASGSMPAAVPCASDEADSSPADVGLDDAASAAPKVPGVVAGAIS